MPVMVAASSTGREPILSTQLLIARFEPLEDCVGRETVSAGLGLTVPHRRPAHRVIIERERHNP